MDLLSRQTPQLDDAVEDSALSRVASYLATEQDMLCLGDIVPVPLRPAAFDSVQAEGDWGKQPESASPLPAPFAPCKGFSASCIGSDVTQISDADLDITSSSCSDGDEDDDEDSLFVRTLSSAADCDATPYAAASQQPIHTSDSASMCGDDADEQSDCESPADLDLDMGMDLFGSSFDQLYVRGHVVLCLSVCCL